MITNWNKFAREMRLGRLLCEARDQTRASGFRGHHKNGGFKGFAESQGISPRRAYRLMQRYLTVLGIILPPFLENPISDSERVTNDSEILDASIEESIEEACKLSRIADSVFDTNAKVSP